MSPQIREQRSPQPFRQWCAWRLDPQGWDRPDAPRVEDTVVERLAFDLGMGERKLRRWRNENESLERIEVEEALHHADVGFWEVYPDAPSLNMVRRGGPGHEPGFRSKLRDDDVRALYELHLKGATIRELGRRIWKRAGYSSIDSAENAIRRGFRRLGLEYTALPPSRFGRCKGIRRWWPNKGAPCSKFAMRGSDYCMQHDEERRAEVLQQTAKAMAVRHGGDLEAAA